MKPRIFYTKPSITELEVRYATDAAANSALCCVVWNLRRMSISTLTILCQVLHKTMKNRIDALVSES